MKNKNPNLSPIGEKFGFDLYGDSCGNRTRVAGVRGRSLNRLTNEPYSLYIIPQKISVVKRKKSVFENFFIADFFLV